ncbi:MAG: YhgE/Pip family protein [Candidatus Nanopelagicales bacterium]|nr:YhgE/Pip family protein [Candidatus Nanopelagicales bacterium]
MTGPVSNSLVRWNRLTALRLAMIAVLVVPLVFGGLMVWSYWNPTGNMNNVPAAIVNEDVPATLPGKTLNAGSQLANTLVSENRLAWTQTTMEEAQKGLDSGAYYIALLIPSDFSADLASIDTASPTQSQLRVITNDATNYVIDEMADGVVERVRVEASEEVQFDFMDAVYTAIEEVQAEGGKAFDNSTTLLEEAKKYAKRATKLADQAAEDVKLDEQTAALMKQIEAASATIPSSASQMATQSASTAKSASAIRKSGSDVDAQLVKIQKELQSQGLSALAKQVGDARTDLDKNVLSQTDSIAQATAKEAAQAKEISTKTSQIATQAKTASTQLAQEAKNSKQVSKAARLLADELTGKFVPEVEEMDRALKRAAAQIPPVTEAERRAFSQVLSQPVKVENDRQNPVAAPGDGYASNFLPVAMFVGAILLLVLVLPLNPRLLHLGRNPVQTVWNSYAPLLIFGSAAAFTMFIGTVAVVGVRAAAYIPLLLVCLVTMACFAAIVQFLKAAIGMAGTYVALLLLALQMAASGSVFPIQSLNSLFGLLHPILPMSYSVDGVRRTIAGGPLMPYVAVDLLVLIGIGALFLAGTVWIAHRRRIRTEPTLKPELDIA